MVALHIVEQQGCYMPYIVGMFQVVVSWNCPFNSCFALLFANAEKCESAKREEACMNRLRNTVGIYIRNIRLSRTQTSTVSEHTNKIGQHPLWNGVRVSDRDPNWYSRRVKEAMLIRRHER